MTIVRFVVGGPVQIGYASFLMKQHDRQDVSVYDLTSQFHRFGTGFLQALLTGLLTALWILLLVVPGIIAVYKYAMVPYLLVDHPEMTAMEAITVSKEMMSGHITELFRMHLSFIGWLLLCSPLLGVGNLSLNPCINASKPLFIGSSPDPEPWIRCKKPPRFC